MPTILVIDDEPGVRRAIGTILRMDGFNVSLAEDGRAGLNLARQLNPDAIVVDIFMPEMDGLGTIRHVQDICPGIPIIAVSGHGAPQKRDCSPDFLSMAIRLGATRALYKPFSADELVSTIHAAMRETAASPPVKRIAQDCPDEESIGEDEPALRPAIKS